MGTVRLDALPQQTFISRFWRVCLQFGGWFEATANDSRSAISIIPLGSELLHTN